MRHLFAADVEGGAATAPAPVSMKELLSNRGVFIGCMIFLLQQFSGVNSVVYFSSSVFAKVQSLPVFPYTPTSSYTSSLPDSAVMEASGLHQH